MYNYLYFLSIYHQERMIPDNLSPFQVAQTCPPFGRWSTFLTSPCVNSELSSLPGSLRSEAPEHFSVLVRHCFFFSFLFFSTTRASKRLTKQEESSKDRWISPRFPTQTQPQMYICVCHFGIWRTHTYSSSCFFSSSEETSLPPSHLMCDMTACVFVHYTFLFCNVQ